MWIKSIPFCARFLLISLWLAHVHLSVWSIEHVLGSNRNFKIQNKNSGQKSSIIRRQQGLGLFSKFKHATMSHDSTSPRPPKQFNAETNRQGSMAPCVMMHDRVRTGPGHLPLRNFKRWERGRRKWRGDRVTTVFSFSSFCRNPVGHSVNHPNRPFSRSYLVESLQAIRFDHLLIFNLFSCVSWFCFEVIWVDTLCFPTRAYKKQSCSWWRWSQDTSFPLLCIDPNWNLNEQQTLLAGVSS